MAHDRPGKIHKKSEVWHRHGKHRHRKLIIRLLEQMNGRRRRVSRLYGSVAELMAAER